ncbi:FAD-binding protein [Acidithrix sp. C25]|uniref:electron transfer flavoprotein subunit alpha/FixB family protein n=1 Tax=Acidithrix sp. C25 TaxID=1671482 RepID=UPI00191BB9D8|nr:FAD-binding protein [Acidithrix sp. C25]
MIKNKLSPNSRPSNNPSTSNPQIIVVIDGPYVPGPLNAISSRSISINLAIMVHRSALKEALLSLSKAQEKARVNLLILEDDSCEAKATALGELIQRHANQNVVIVGTAQIIALAGRLSATLNRLAIGPLEEVRAQAFRVRERSKKIRCYPIAQNNLIAYYLHNDHRGAKSNQSQELSIAANHAMRWIEDHLSSQVPSMQSSTDSPDIPGEIEDNLANDLAYELANAMGNKLAKGQANDNNNDNDDNNESCAPGQLPLLTSTHLIYKDGECLGHLIGELATSKTWQLTNDKGDPIISTTVIEVAKDQSAGLFDAPIVFGIGAGVGSKAAFAKVVEAAKLLEVQYGATRVAFDFGWCGHDRQIGTTGISIEPKLYVAFGVSGAPQHMGGIARAQEMISINIDEGAPITNSADLSIKADATAVIEAIIARVTSNATSTTSN